MKNKLKYLLVTVLLVAFSLCFTVSASAEESTEATETTEENVFSTVYEEISKYASEILCALTFAGSMILAFAYKKGLLPLVKGSLLSIGNAVSKIKEEAAENAEKGSKLGEDIGNRLDGAKTTLDALAEKVSDLDLILKEKLKSEDDLEREKEELKLIITSQIDMLYDIFMASALPQYQKDAVGEKIAKMKGAIGENEVGI